MTKKKSGWAEPGYKIPEAGRPKLKVVHGNGNDLFEAARREIEAEGKAIPDEGLEEIRSGYNLRQEFLDLTQKYNTLEVGAIVPPQSLGVIAYTIGEMIGMGYRNANPDENMDKYITSTLDKFREDMQAGSDHHGE